MDEQNPYYHQPQPPPVPVSPPPIPYQPPAVEYLPHVTPDEKSMAMLCHLLAILTGFIGPLILWLVKKDTSPFIDHHGREALNFQLTVFIVMLALTFITLILMFVVIGFVLIPVIFVLGILALVAEILACIAANKGEWHRYPFCIRVL
jgi:uncharacterized protein